MAQNPATLDRNENLDMVESIMNHGRIRHMPVVEDGRVVGIISQRDLFRSATSAVIKTIKVKEVMTEKVLTISPEASIQDAARLMIDNRIGCLPVVEADRLIGLVTKTDILRYVVES